MNKKWWYFLFLWLTSCGKSGSFSSLESSQIPEDQLLLLSQLREHLKEQYLRKVQGNKGNWPSDSDCDGALWAGIARAAGIEEVQMHLALTWEGRPTRLPCGDCGPKSHGFNDGSAATTSTDMMLGILLGLFSANDLASLEKFRKYADENRGIMGTPKDLIARTWIKPGTRSFLSQAIQKLGGSPDSWSSVPQVYAPPQKDYELHLELLSIYLGSLLKGHLSTLDKSVLALEAESNPQDALAQALSGNRKKAASLILDPSWTPPGYVRGPETAGLVHRLFILNLLLSPLGNVDN